MNRRPPQPRDRSPLKRRDRRDRNRKKPDWVAGLRSLLILVLIAQSLRVAFASPRLRLQEIRVQGTTRLTAADVAREGGVPLGQNIFRVNLVRVSEGLLKDPVIRDAVVTRELPNSLNVEIRERTPAYEVACRGVRWDVDRENVLFRKSQGYMQGQALLEVQPADLPKPGHKVRADLAKARTECVKLAKKEGLDLRHLRVDGAGELWLNIETSPTKMAAPAASSERDEAAPETAANPGRLKVRLGRATELPQKFRDIRQALQGWPNLTATAAHLDVMCAGRPAYMSAAKSGVDQAPRSP